MITNKQEAIDFLRCKDDETCGKHKWRFHQTFQSWIDEMLDEIFKQSRKKMTYTGTANFFAHTIDLTADETVYVDNDDDLPAFFKLKEIATENLIELIKEVNAKASFYDSKFVEDKDIVKLCETAHSDGCDFLKIGKKYKVTIEEIGNG